MLASDVISAYESFCPPELSMPGDSVGLQIGTLHKSIKKVMVTLDVREQTVAEAISQGVDLIITKHAPIFRPIKHLQTDDAQNRIYLDLLKNDIAVYVSHTNIDIVEGGLNDWLADKLDVQDRTYLTPVHENQGIGRVGKIKAISLGDLITKVKVAYHLKDLRLIAYEGIDLDQEIERLALSCGASQDFYPDAVKKGAQVFITGDISYHFAQDMISRGLIALDVGHYIESLFIEKVAEKLQSWKEEYDWDLEILASTAITLPFKTV